jgi:hypothetical protein
VTSLTELSGAAWDAAVAASGEQFRFSHRADAGAAFQRAFPSYEFRPCRVDYADATSLLWPLVAVRRRLDALSTYLAMPLGLEGRPIVAAGAPRPQHVEALFASLQCGRLDVCGGAGGSPPGAGRLASFSTHVLDLTPGYAAVWSDSFPAKTRNMCRKAERGGLTVEQDASPESIAAYAALYRASSKVWGYDTPPYPDVLFEALLASEWAELWLARIDGAIVGGAVMLRGSDDLLYWSGAMNRDYRHLAPSNAIIRAVVEDACERGIAYLDFGASAGLSGVEAFKRSFGAQERDYTVATLSTWGYRQLERVQQGAARVRAKSHA